MSCSYIYTARKCAGARRSRQFIQHTRTKEFFRALAQRPLALLPNLARQTKPPSRIDSGSQSFSRSLNAAQDTQPIVKTVWFDFVKYSLEEFYLRVSGACFLCIGTFSMFVNHLTYRTCDIYTCAHVLLTTCCEILKWEYSRVFIHNVLEEPDHMKFGFWSKHALNLYPSVSHPNFQLLAFCFPVAYRTVRTVVSKYGNQQCEIIVREPAYQCHGYLLELPSRVSLLDQNKHYQNDLSRSPAWRPLVLGLQIVRGKWSCQARINQ